MPLFSLQLFNSFYYCVSLFSSHSSLFYNIVWLFNFFHSFVDTLLKPER